MTSYFWLGEWLKKVRQSPSSSQIREISQLKGLALFPGKRLAFLESDILLKNGDKIVVKGAHTKFLWDCASSEINVFTIISDLVIETNYSLNNLL